jgi:hypothetical protein
MVTPASLTSGTEGFDHTDVIWVRPAIKSTIASTCVAAQQPARRQWLRQKA